MSNEETLYERGQQEEACRIVRMFDSSEEAVRFVLRSLETDREAWRESRQECTALRAVLTREKLISVITRSRWEFAGLWLDGKQPTTDQWSALVANAILALPEVAAIVRELETYKKSRFVNEFYERYHQAYHLPALPWLTEKHQAPSEDLRSPLQAPPKPGTGTGTEESNIMSGKPDDDRIQWRCSEHSSQVDTDFHGRRL